jgi:small subunit ribosomal protein S10
MEGERIRIFLKSYDYYLIDKACLQIVDVAKKTGAAISGPVPLPNKRERFCVIRSPHVNKESRELFDLCCHKRLIDVSTSNRTVESLLDLVLPSGVHIEVKMK